MDDRHPDASHPRRQHTRVGRPAAALLEQAERAHHWSLLAHGPESFLNAKLGGEWRADGFSERDTPQAGRTAWEEQHKHPVLPPEYFHTTLPAAEAHAMVGTLNALGVDPQLTVLTSGQIHLRIRMEDYGTLRSTLHLKREPRDEQDFSKRQLPEELGMSTPPASHAEKFDAPSKHTLTASEQREKDNPGRAR